MGALAGERLVKEWIADRTHDTVAPVFNEVDASLDAEKLDQVIWETVTAGTVIEPGDFSVNPHEIHGDVSGVESVKGSNIEFDVHGLAKVATASASTIGAVTVSPLLAAVVSLGVLASVKELATEQLELEDGVVYYSLVRASDGTVCSRSALRSEVDDVVDEIDPRVAIPESQLTQSLATLINIDAVEVLDTSPEERYHPVETCSVSFE